MLSAVPGTTSIREGSGFCGLQFKTVFFLAVAENYSLHFFCVYMLEILQNDCNYVEEKLRVIWLASCILKIKNHRMV